MRLAWTQLIRSLPGAGMRHFAAGLTLERVAGTTLHLSSPVQQTGSALHKLAAALNAHTGQPITLILQHGPARISARAYADRVNQDHKEVADGQARMALPATAALLPDYLQNWRV